MKNQMKKHLLKATSVGMAAMMAATPLTAFAEDTVSDADAPEVENVAVEGADAAEGEQDTTSEEKKEEKKETAEAVEAVETANGLLEETEELAGEEDPDEDYAEDELDAVQTDIDQMKEAGAAVDNAEASNVELVEQAEEVASDAKENAEKQEEKFDGYVADMKAAETVIDAETVKALADQVAEDAKNDYNAAVEEYNGIMDQIEANDKAIEDAQKKYDDALKEGKENLATAISDLEAAEAKATELKEAAEAAQAKAAGAEAIIEAQSKRVEKSNAWDDKKVIFREIINNYYIPKVKGGKVTRIDYDGSGEAQVGKVASYDGDAHNYKVTYTDENGKHVVYLNYKLDESYNLIIFEKTETDIDLYRYEKKKGSYVEVDPTRSDVKDATDKNNKTDKYLLDEASAQEDVKVTVGQNNVTSIDLTKGTTTYSADGTQVVKTVTGEVTKVTTTQATLAGGDTQYATEAAALEAAQAKRDELVDGKAANEEIAFTAATPSATKTEEVSHEVYDSTITYVPQFKATVAIDVESEYNFFKETEKGKVGANFAKTALGQLLAAEGYRVAEIEYENETHTWSTDVAHIKSVTFAKVGSTKVKEKDFFAIGTGALKPIEKEEAEDKYEDEGGLAVLDVDIVDNGHNDDMFTADFTYYYGEQKTATGTGADADTATEAARAQAKADYAEVTAYLTKKLGVTVAFDIRTEIGEPSATSRKVVDQAEYWTIDDAAYTKTTTTVEENQIISETAYNATKLEHIVKHGWYSNSNYYKYKNDGDASGILLFEKTDERFLKFLSDYTDAQDIIDKADEALQAYDTAKTKVNDLKQALADLTNSAAPTNSASVIAKRAELQAKLDAAEKDLEDAEDAVDRIADKVDKLEEEYTAKVKELTPAPTNDEDAGNGEAGNNEATSNGTDTTAKTGATVPNYITVISPSAPVSMPIERVDTTTAITPVAEATVAEETTSAVAETPAAAPAVATDAAPAVVAPAVMTADAAQAVTAPAGNLIAAQPVPAPMDQMTLDGGDDAAVVEEEGTTEAKPLIEAGDVESARANLTLEDEVQANSIYGWWWLLLIAILGGTGYTMYRKYQQKKAREIADDNK